MDLLKPKRLDKGRIEELENKIREKVDRYYNTPEDEYLPEHSRIEAIISDLYEYTISNPNYAKYAEGEHGLYEYGMEIFKTCSDVMKAYSPDKGDFIHYFNKSISVTLYKSKGKLLFDKMHQVTSTLSENKIRALSKHVRMMREEGDIVDVEHVIKLEKNANLTVDDVLEYTSTEIRIESTIDEDGKSEFVDILQSQSCDQEYTPSEPKDPIEIEKQIKHIDEIFLTTREAQRGYLSEALTADLSEALYEILEHYPDYRSLLDETSWFDAETFQVFLDTRIPRMQKDIARKYGKHESVITRAKKGFIERI